VYQVDYFNLDVIISIGYRIKSKRGTQFRIWANKVLKSYLIKGFSINEQLLTQKTERLKELQQIAKTLGNVLNFKTLNIESRYPSHKEKLLQGLTKKKCEEILKSTNG